MAYGLLVEMWHCPRCDQDLPAEAFYPSQRRPGKWCSACHLDYLAEQRQNELLGIRPRASDVCLRCGTDIRHRRTHALYCSKACSQSILRKRRRAARAAQQV